MGGLGSLLPPDWDHISKYPLAALIDKPVHVPVTLSVNWYTNFDHPQKYRDGSYFVGSAGADKLGTLRGRHCVCLEPVRDNTRPGGEQDNSVWWPFYNQGAEGSCEGHGHSRLMSLLNRKRYNAVWLYNEAQKNDGIEGPHEGTTARAVLDVLRTQGHRVAYGPETTELTHSDAVSRVDGIVANRWARTVDEVLLALGSMPSLQYVTILNSWGLDYPERVHLPTAVLARLLSEDGEAAVVTDR